MDWVQIRSERQSFHKILLYIIYLRFSSYYHPLSSIINDTFIIFIAMRDISKRRYDSSSVFLPKWGTYTDTAWQADSISIFCHRSSIHYFQTSHPPAFLPPSVDITQNSSHESGMARMRKEKLIRYLEFSTLSFLFSLIILHKYLQWCLFWWQIFTLGYDVYALQSTTRRHKDTTKKGCRKEYKTLHSLNGKLIGAIPRAYFWLFNSGEG